jgi:hypothetical protein
MNMQWLKITLCTLAVLVVSTIGFGRPPTPQEALEYAKSVVLVKRVLKDNKIHSYVKEVWRFDPSAGTPPVVGSEYGRPMPYDSRMQHPERDGIVFKFGADRPSELTIGWTIPVTEDGMVFPFQGHIDGVRMVVKNTNPKE